MVVHDKFVYLCFPKTGSILLREFLLKNVPGAVEVKGRVGKWPKSAHDTVAQKDGRFVFGGIRNPWSWYVSFWNMLTRDPVHGEEYFEKGRDFRTFLIYTLTEKRGRGYLFNFDRMAELGVGCVAHEFIRLYCEGNVETHSLEDGPEIVDAVYRQEDLLESFIEMFEENVFGLSEEQVENLTGRGRVNAYPHKPYADYYDEETAELVRQKDKRIIERFGYEF